MQPSPLELPDAADAARKLSAALDLIPTHAFVALDGALFDNLPGDLLKADISCRSLFRAHNDQELERAGPWLAALNSESARTYAKSLALAQPCAVFWSCPRGGAALWRHLRTLNEALIPVDGAGAEGGSPARPTFERVLFRHWDPNVLAVVMPLLDDWQFARIFGPADYILMNGPDTGGIKRIPRPENLPPPPSGPLRLSPVQMEELKAAMVHSSRQRIARYLKKNSPEHFTGVDDAFLWGTALASEKSAGELGIVTERGRARWAYVMMLSDGKAAEINEVRSFILNGGSSPERQVSALMKHTAAALRDGSAGVV